MTQLTIQDLSSVVPKTLKSRIDQNLVDKINTMNLDPEFREHYRENLVSYTSVLNGSKWTMDQYVDAVRYVSYKLMGDTNVKAYARTFATKFAHFKQTGVEDKTIARYVTAYNKSKLVNAIWEQTAIPFHVFNQDHRQRALMVQIELMTTANSEKVRSDAANSVLTHLKPPETAKIELDVVQKDSSEITDLRKAVQDLVTLQRDTITSGSMNAKEIAHSRLIVDGEFVEGE